MTLGPQFDAHGGQGRLMGPDVGKLPEKPVPQRIQERASRNEASFGSPQGNRGSWQTTRTAQANDRLHMNPGTNTSDNMPMFMSARDIKSKYQVLDGDREDGSNSWGGGTENTDSRAGSRTARSRRTDAVTNEAHHTWDNSAGNGRGQWKAASGSKPFVRRTNAADTTETDEQVYDRKYEEASMDPEEYAYSRGENPKQKYINAAGNTTDRSYSSRETHSPQSWMGTGTAANVALHGRGTVDYHEQHPGSGDSLAEHVMRHGVSEPVHLSNQFGSMGKPSIVGGHHRIAVMGAEAPDRLMPVLHHTSIQDARFGAGSAIWKYT